MTEHIKLLSGKPLCKWTPSEYKLYVKSLYKLPRKKKTTVKVQKPYSWRVTAKRKISIRMYRETKWLSREEVDAIVSESGLPANEVWLYVLDKKRGFRISTQEDEERIAQELSDIPF